ncbi:MAG: TonB-dependent receptor [Chitinophagaceae bacterium]|nr:TonB-dependent receptor [Chitinophagaceae bacterium]
MISLKKARRTLSLSAIGDFKESNGISNQLSYNNYYKGGISNTKDTVDQQNKSINASTTITTSVAFTEPINKYLSLGINLSVNVANTGNDRNVFTPDGSGKYTVKYDSLSNEFDFKTSTYKPGFVLRLVKKKITAMLGTSVGYNRFEQVNNTKNITQHYNFTNFFPTAGIRFTLKGNKRININYRGSAAAPSLQQLQPVPDNSNPLSIYTGNPNLKQSFTHNFSGGFNWSKPLSDNSIWSYFNYSTTNNAFTEYTTRDTIGRLFYKTINTNGNYYINLNLDYNFSVGKGKNKVGLGINPYIQLNKTNEFVDSILNTNYSNTYSVRLNVNKYKEDKFEFYFGPSISYTQSKSNINNTSNTNLWSMSGWADMTIYIKKKTQISANGNFNFRQKDPRYTKNNNYTTLNASVKQYLYKKEVSVKLGVYDIFNQNRGYSSDFSSYKFTESYFNTLKRYWLLTLSWEFNHQKQKAAPASVTK